MKRGLLINNIGTPASPSKEDVKRYLDEFLMDPDVIPLPKPLRFLLVKGLITPRRSHVSGEKYAQIWTERGSPLMVHTMEFASALQKRLGEGWSVKIGMRYGAPSIRQALEHFKHEGVKSFLLAPMFPQFADATTGSAQSETHKQLMAMEWNPKTLAVDPFYDRASYIECEAKAIEPFLKDSDHLLFSFHGLPESHIKKNPGCLETPTCCQRAHACALNCYRAQTFKTANDIAKKLDLPPEKWSVSFQSRLGRAKWIGPSTEETIRNLAQRGLKNLTVACPAFVADCLETLEEIGIVGKAEFLKHGGREFNLVPCLNSRPDWVESFAQIIEKMNLPQVQ